MPATHSSSRRTSPVSASSHTRPRDRPPTSTVTHSPLFDQEAAGGGPRAGREVEHHARAPVHPRVAGPGEHLFLLAAAKEDGERFGRDRLRIHASRLVAGHAETGRYLQSRRMMSRPAPTSGPLEASIPPAARTRGGAGLPTSVKPRSSTLDLDFLEAHQTLRSAVVGLDTFRDARQHFGGDGLAEVDLMRPARPMQRGRHRRRVGTSGVRLCPPRTSVQILPTSKEVRVRLRRLSLPRSR